MSGKPLLCALVLAISGCADCIRIKDVDELGETSWGASVDGHWKDEGDRRDRVFRDLHDPQPVGSIDMRSDADAVLVFARDRAPLGRKVTWTTDDDVVEFEARPYVRLPLALHVVHPLSWDDSLFPNPPWSSVADAPGSFTLGDDKLWGGAGDDRASAEAGSGYGKIVAVVVRSS